MSKLLDIIVVLWNNIISVISIKSTPGRQVAWYSLGAL